MRALALILMSLPVLAGLAGCSTWREQELEADANNRHIINAVMGEMETQGTITQHALYGYHFVPGTAELNELGRRDLDVLSRHWRAHGGSGVLTVCDGESAPGLREARVEAAARYLAGQGISGPALTLERRGWPGGDGTGAERAGMLLRMADPTSEARQGEPQPQSFKIPAVESGK